MRVVVDADGDLRMLNVEKDRWHSLECLESGSVLYESKDGADWRLALFIFAGLIVLLEKV